MFVVVVVMVMMMVMMMVVVFLCGWGRGGALCANRHHIGGVERVVLADRFVFKISLVLHADFPFAFQQGNEIGATF